MDRQIYVLLWQIISGVKAKNRSQAIKGSKGKRNFSLPQPYYVKGNSKPRLSRPDLL